MRFDCTTLINCQYVSAFNMIKKIIFDFDDTCIIFLYIINKYVIFPLFDLIEVRF